MGVLRKLSLYYAGIITIGTIAAAIVFIFAMMHVFDFSAMRSEQWIWFILIALFLLSSVYIAFRLVKWLVHRQQGDGDKIVLVCAAFVAVFFAFVYVAGEKTWLSTIITWTFVLFPTVYTFNSFRKWVKNRGKPSNRNKKPRGRQETTWEQEHYEQSWRQQEEQRRQEEYARQQAEYARQQQTRANYGEDSPFEILGVSETASEYEVKDAWRRKCKTWHADKFTPEQLSDPKFNKMVNEEMSKINAAYEEIKRRKGWR